MRCVSDMVSAVLEQELETKEREKCRNGRQWTDSDFVNLKDESCGGSNKAALIKHAVIVRRITTGNLKKASNPRLQFDCSRFLPTRAVISYLIISTILSSPWILARTFQIWVRG